MDSKQTKRVRDFELAVLEVSSETSSKLRKALKRESELLSRKECFQEYFKSCTRDDYRILNYCATRGMAFFIDLLLEHFKLDPNLLESGKMTLHWAVEAGHLDVVDSLLKSRKKGIPKADVDAKDIFGSTALHIAIYQGRIGEALKLLKYNARTDIEDHFGTPLHAAILFERKDIVMEIHRINPERVNKVVQGFCSPILCAMLDDSNDCEDFLLKVCDVVDKPLLHTVISSKQHESDAFKVVEVLLERGAGAHLFEEGTENLPIIAAAKKKWTSVMELLIDCTTSRIDNVEWSISGLVQYVESEEFIEMDRGRADARVQTLKARIIEELRRNYILAAVTLSQSLRNDMITEEWSWYSNLCHLIASLKIRGVSVGVDAESIFEMVDRILKQENYELALSAALGTLALVSDPHEKKYQDKLIEVKNAEKDFAAAKNAEERSAPGCSTSSTG